MTNVNEVKLRLTTLSKTNKVRAFMEVATKIANIVQYLQVSQ